MNSGFAEHGVYYGTNKNGAWEYESVAGSSISSALAIDDEGFVHIAHAVKKNQSNNYDLYYTTNLSGDWAHERVANYITCGWETSIAIDQGGFAHIGFEIYWAINATGYATNQKGYWEVTPIFNEYNDGMSTSIALDQNTTPYIAHHNHFNGTLKLATPASGSWSTEVIDSVGYNRGRLAGGDKINKYIIYEQEKDENDLLNIANLDNEGIWNIINLGAPISNISRSYSLTVDLSGFAHVVFYDDDILQYATSNNGNWNIIPIRSGIENARFSISAPHTDDIYISFIDEGVWYMSKQNGLWEEFLIDPDGNRSPDLNVDQNGFLHIVYVNKDKGLSYSANQNGSWITDIITNENHSNVTSELDLHGYSHVIAYNNDRDRLCYYSNKTGGWQNILISDVPADHDICVDSHNRVSIVNDCQYFHQEDGQWIASENCVLPAEFSSIQVDKNDMAHGLMNYRGGLWYVVFPRDYQ